MHDRELSDENTRDSVPDSRSDGPASGSILPPAGGATLPLPPRRAAPEPAQSQPVINGRYRLVGELGRGGMGIVYAAHDDLLDRPVALKRLVGGSLATASDLERFEREARAAASVQHSGLVRVHDLDFDEGEPFFTMDLIRGRSLRRHLRPGEAWEAPRAVRLMIAVSRALAAAHAQGLVHRDVKPENILIRDEDGAPLVTDFGIARSVDAAGSSLTRTGEMLGTPAYMPPEQALGQRDRIGPATDVYALGAVLYELLAGRKAYEGSSVSVLGALLVGPPPQLRSLRPEVPLDLAAICERAMAREPAARYASADDLADDLQRYLDGTPVRALDGRWRLRLHHLTRGRERLLLGGAAVIALLLLLGVGRWWLDARAEQARQAGAEERRVALEARISALIAEGRQDDASALHRAFVDLPENRGTSALVRAWIDEGHRLEARFEQDGALSAFASAFTSAEAEADQDTALLALANAFTTSGRWPALASSLDRLRARGVPRERLVGLEVSLALGLRDIRGALGAWPAGLASPDVPGRTAALRAILEGFQGATPLGRRLDQAALLPPGVGPPGGAFIARDLDQDSFIIGDTTFNELEVWPHPAGAASNLTNVNFLLAPGEPPRVLAGFDARRDQPIASQLLTLQGSELRLEKEWSGRRFLSGAAVRFPWGLELVGGEGPYTRDLQWIRPDGAQGWSITPVDRAISATFSDVHKVLGADLDGDGLQELVVALGAWRAMDLRVLRPGATPSDPLELVGRSRIGVVSDVAVLHPAGGPEELVAWRLMSPTNAQVFGAEPDPPPQMGLFRFVLRGGALERRHQELVGLTMSTEVRRLIVADLDADGVEELLASDDDALMVLRRVGEDRWEALTLPGLALVLALNADADAALELVVRVVGEPVSWVLGVGDQALPVAARGGLPALPQAQAPLTDPALVAGRERALQVAALGLDRDAAGYLDRLAAVAAIDEDRAALQLVAAQLWEAAGLPQRAIEAYTVAATAPALEPDALEGLERVLEHEHRFEEAEAANARLIQVAVGDVRVAAVARAERLSGLSGVDSSVIDLKVGLPPTLEVEDPLAVVQSPGRGLVVTVPVWASAVARLPLRCSGPRVGLRVAARVTNTAWASSITLGFAPAGEGVEQGQLSFLLSAGGGGGSNIRHVSCNWVRSRVPPAWLRQPLPSWSEQEDLDLLLDATETPSTSVCQGALQGRPLTGAATVGPAVWPSGDVDLVVGGAPWQVADPAQVASIELQRLEIIGCVPRSVEDGRGAQAGLAMASIAQRAARALASGDAHAALALYHTVQGDQGVVGQFAALVALGRVDEAAEIGARIQGPHDLRVWMMKRGPTVAGALLRRLGPAGLPLFLAATDTDGMQPPVEASTLALMAAAHLDGVSPEAIGPGGAQVLQELYAARGQAALVTGDLRRARADLEAALAIPSPVAARDDMRAQLHRARVQLALAEGDSLTALEHARLAIAESDAPEIAADRLLALPEVQRQLTDPAWRAALGR